MALPSLLISIRCHSTFLAKPARQQKSTAIARTVGSWVLYHARTTRVTIRAFLLLTKLDSPCWFSWQEHTVSRRRQSRGQSLRNLRAPIRYKLQQPMRKRPLPYQGMQQATRNHQLQFGFLSRARTQCARCRLRITFAAWSRQKAALKLSRKL